MFSFNVYRNLVLVVSAFLALMKRISAVQRSLSGPFFWGFLLVVAPPLFSMNTSSGGRAYLMDSYGSASQVTGGTTSLNPYSLLSKGLSSTLAKENLAAYGIGFSHEGTSKTSSGGRNGVVSPDGRFIVYVGDDSNSLSSKSGSSLFVKRADQSSKIRRLTDNFGKDDFPAFSRDGKDVFFHSDRGGLTKIWKVPLRGGKPVQVTFGASQEYHPAPSPDGRYLAFDSNRSGNYDIWIMDLSDDSEHQITTSAGPDFSPSWSPRGKALCYTGTDSTGFQIYVKKPFVKGASPIQITWGKGVRAHPAWSPSGKLIAYDFGKNGVVNLWVTSLKKPFQASQVTFSEISEEVPRWYPDSDRLIYSVKNQDSVELASANLPIILPDGSISNGIGHGVQPQVAMGSGGSSSGDTTLNNPWTEGVVPGSSGNNPYGVSARAAGAPLEMPEDIDFMKDLEPSVPEDGLSGSTATEDSTYDESSVVSFGTGERTGSSQGEDVFSQEETGLLRVLQFYPKYVRGGVEPPDSISIVFDKKVSPGNRFEDLLSLTDDQKNIYPLLVNYSPHLCRLDAITSSPLEHGRKYMVTLSSSIIGESGEKLKRDFVWSFETNGSAPVRKVEIVPLKKFEISEMSPHKVAATSDEIIECVFTNPLNPETIDSSSVMLFDSKGAKVPGEVAFPEGDYTLQLKPYSPLVSGNTYRVFVSQNVTSSTGEKLNGAHVWSFTVAHQSPLAIIGYEPKGFLKADSDITIHFNRPVDPKSIQTGQFFLKTGTESFSGNTIVGMGGKSLLFVPHRRFPNNSELTLVVPPGLTDTTGQELVMDTPVRFSVRYKNDTGASFVTQLIEKHSRKEKNDSSLALKGLSKIDSKELIYGTPLYKKLVALFDKGFIDKNLGGDLERKTTLSRYKAALLVESAIKNMQLMTSAQKQDVRALAGEFKSELQSLGVKIAAIFGTHQVVGRA